MTSSIRRYASPWSVTNAVIVWNTVYLHEAVDELRRIGHPVTDVAACPARDEHLNPYGNCTFDIEPTSARAAADPTSIAQLSR